MMTGTRTRGTILVVEDDAVFNRLIVRHLERMGLKATGVDCWQAAHQFLGRSEPDLILLDVQLPDSSGLKSLPEIVSDCPVIVLTAFGSVEQAVEAIKLGAAEYIMKPVNLEELEVMVSRALDNAHLRRDVHFYKSRSACVSRPFMVGRSGNFREVLRIIDAVGPSDTTVLIQGESGVGKELVAREVHEQSPRKDRNFVPLDCCTLQENLFESELFGHERGAFTGADRQKTGLIEVANGGTLFLDEIGEIAPAIQAKLLRVLETGHYRRLGGTKDLSADVRIIAATNRDLASMSREGNFRADLYYRLSAFVIDVPPLRDRREDIVDLVDNFLNHHNFSRRVNKALTGGSLECLMTYDWPGNVRELRNVVERSIILSGDDPEIRPEHLGLRAQRRPAAKPAASTGITLSFDDEPDFDQLKEAYLKKLLAKYAGHRASLTRPLGLSERNIYRLLKRYGLQDYS